jgi:hypothetical protein
MMFKKLKADISYSLGTDNGEISNSERLHADIEYKTLFWRFRYWHNDADFYDLFGPTERARKGDAFIVAYRRPVIFDGPRRLYVDFDVSYFTGLDTLPGNQNVEAQFEDLLSIRGELNYEHTQKSLGAVDHEKGIYWDLAAYIDQAASTVVPKLRGGFDFGLALPMKHSSLWLYNSAGIAGGNRKNSLAKWYFGAFGNNWVDDREVRRYRKFFSFPGFDIDQLEAQNFVKTVLEWNLPPIRFDNVGTPSFFLTSARPALFAGVLLADVGDSEYSENYYNLGFQLDLAFKIAHRLPMMLSFGYAHGFADGDTDGSEVMVSLKIF